MLSENADLMITEEACEALRRGDNTLYTPLIANQLKAYRNGRAWRIPKQAVIESIIAKLL